MTRLDGRFIKPGSIPADRLDPTIQLGGGGGALADGAVTPAKLAAALLRKFVVVFWGEVSTPAPETRLVTLELRTFQGQPLTAAHILRITCDERARLSVGVHGLVLSGPDSPDLIARTDESGQLDLLLSCSVLATISVAAGPTQGSPLLDTTATIDVPFT